MAKSAISGKNPNVANKTAQFRRKERIYDMKNKKQPSSLPMTASTACLAAGFYLLTALPSQEPAISINSAAGEHVAIQGAAAFKHDLYFGDDRGKPKKPTRMSVKDEELLADYGG